MEKLEVMVDLIKEVKKRRTDYKVRMGIEVGVPEVIDEVVYENVDPDNQEDLAKADATAINLINFYKSISV